MTGETKLTVHIGHFEEVRYTEPVVYIMTGCTLHFTIEQHIIINGTAQTAVCGGRRKQPTIAGGQRIGIIKGDGVIGTQVITANSSDPGRRIDKIGAGCDPAEILQGNSTIVTAQTQLELAPGSLMVELPSKVGESYRVYPATTVVS